MRKPKKIKKTFSLGESKESIKKYANKQEKEISNQLGAKLMPASGATPFMKGDMILNTVDLIDVKSTKSKRIIVDEGMLKKLEDDAFRGSKRPLLILNFSNKQFKAKNKRWVLMPISEYNNEKNN